MRISGAKTKLHLGCVLGISKRTRYRKYSDIEMCRGKRNEKKNVRWNEYMYTEKSARQHFVFKAREMAKFGKPEGAAERVRGRRS